jgi:hypothetical protein
MEADVQKQMCGSKFISIVSRSQLKVLYVSETQTKLFAWNGSLSQTCRLQVML